MDKKLGKVKNTLDEIKNQSEKSICTEEALRNSKTQNSLSYTKKQSETESDLQANKSGKIIDIDRSDTDQIFHEAMNRVKRYSTDVELRKSNRGSKSPFKSGFCKEEFVEIVDENTHSGKHLTTTNFND